MNKVIIALSGGLGNQMFQYAFGYAISKHRSEILELDISGYRADKLRKYDLGLYKIKDNTIIYSKILNLTSIYNIFIYRIIRKIILKIRKLFDTGYYKEPNLNFDENVFNNPKIYYFDGYWQSEEYFKKYRDDLLNIFTLTSELTLLSKQYHQEILNTNSISVHVRRTDKLTIKQDIVCSVDYFKQAIHLMKDDVLNPHFFIFSDDIDWGKENFDFIEKKTFIELEKNAPDQEEMYLMSQCKHNITSNSSFSWWGAWLNRNTNKIIITPKVWFANSALNISDLIPKTWRQL